MYNTPQTIEIMELTYTQYIAFNKRWRCFCLLRHPYVF